MSTGQRLFQAILDHPEDDAARLVYADWLDEYGDEQDRARAEFIRLGIEHARVDAEPCVCGDSPDPTGCHRCRRVGRLLKQSRRFRDPVFPDCDNVLVFPDDPYRIMGLTHYTGPRIQWDWSRGWVQEVRCPLDAWMQHGPALVRQHPVERVEITDREPQPYRSVRGWHRGDHIHAATDLGANLWSIPPELWEVIAMLPGVEIYGPWADFPTADAARDALSTACLVHAKQKEPV